MYPAGSNRVGNTANLTHLQCYPCVCVGFPLGNPHTRAVWGERMEIDIPPGLTDYRIRRTAALQPGR